jgi:hydroxyacylglutathione hydrolase
MVVDVSQDEKIEGFFAAQGEPNLISGIKKVLTTHKHWDHCNGNLAMHDHCEKLDIVGGKHDNVPGATTQVEDGDLLEVEGIAAIKCFHTPCHTAGHIIF